MGEGSAGKVIRFGLYEADLAAGELRKSGSRLRLQEQPFQILAALLERPGEVVTREDLRQRLWPGGTFVDFDHSLNTAVNKLREVLDDSATSPRYIETLPRRGYRFLAPVEKQAAGAGSEAASSGAAPQLPPAAQGHDLPRAPRGVSRGLLLLIQAMYLAFYVAALTRLESLQARAELLLPGWGGALLAAAIATAVIGLPLRLYLMTALFFDYHLLRQKFLKLFPAIVALDLAWALAPLLLAPELGLGAAVALTAGLLFLPFSQRTLVRMAY